jgi:hypothetical protein
MRTVAWLFSNKAKEMVLMFRARLVVLSLVATVLGLGALAASASAGIKFEWLVGGKLLAAGQERLFFAESDKPFDIHGSVAGVNLLLLSEEVLGHGDIIGGKPGTNLELLRFEDVTVDNPAKCLVETDEEDPVPDRIQTNLLKSEIVESDPGGEPLILYFPAVAGDAFASFLFLDKGTETCPLAGVLASLTGNVLAEPLPALADVLTQDLDYEAKTKNFFLSTGVLDKAGLAIAGNPATLTGLLLVTLFSDELFGIF